MRQAILRIRFSRLLFVALVSLRSFPALAADLPQGFVRLADIDPTIRQDIRYSGLENFLHRRVEGYDAPVCILTEQAARALSTVQKNLATQNLTLTVFDCYRPARAVSDMVEWTKQAGPPDPQWYPKVERGNLIAEGYVGAQSSHSRGSTIDVALALTDKTTGPKPACGAPDADTLDFGTGFDCFDPSSETASSLVSKEAAANRNMLLETMRAAGFRNYAREWWHFTLRGEPYPAKRFDFPVTAR